MDRDLSSQMDSPLLLIPREILRVIVIECENPCIFRTAKFFNTFSLDTSFWNKIIYPICGRTVDRYSDDPRFALTPCDLLEVVRGAVTSVRKEQRSNS
jgi:hypothetical protein